MTDYISRDAVLDALCKASTPCFSSTEKPILVFDVDYVPAINSIHAADVAPVVHGRWIKARGSWCTPGGDPVWECSECGKGVHVYGIEHGTYGYDVSDKQWVACPNCGARMEGS